MNALQNNKARIFTMIIMLLALNLSLTSQDVTVDEIIDTYIEVTGGQEAWSALKGIKMTATVNQGGMEIPLEIVQLSDGRTYTKASVQGMTIMQNVYDGTVVWNTNYMNMKAEKADEETLYNVEMQAKDFPEALFNYKDKGYTAELMGMEEIEGTEAYKVKLTKKPMKIDGEMVDNVTFYYFDTENMVVIAAENEIKQGPQKGSIGLTTLSDYQEVDGLYFPFSMSQGLKGGPSQPMSFDSIVLNPEVEDSAFTFPEQ